MNVLLSTIVTEMNCLSQVKNMDATNLKNSRYCREKNARSLYFGLRQFHALSLSPQANDVKDHGAQNHPNKSTDVTGGHVGRIMNAEVYPADADGQDQNGKQDGESNSQQMRPCVTQQEIDQKSIKRHRAHGMSTRIT